MRFIVKDKLFSPWTPCSYAGSIPIFSEISEIRSRSFSTICQTGYPGIVVLVLAWSERQGERTPTHSHSARPPTHVCPLAKVGFLTCAYPMSKRVLSPSQNGCQETALDLVTNAFLTWCVSFILISIFSFFVISSWTTTILSKLSFQAPTMSPVL